MSQEILGSVSFWSETLTSERNAQVVLHTYAPMTLKMFGDFPEMRQTIRERSSQK